MVHVAYGQTLVGYRANAVDMLLSAERLAPQEVHCRPTPQCGIGYRFANR